MVVPDQELALEILDALDDRVGLRFSPLAYGRAMGLERAWVEQACGMIDGLDAWLARQKQQAEQDAALRQAITTLCDRLAIARDALLQDMAEMDAAAAQRWRAPQRGGGRTAVVPASGARKGRR